MSLRCPTCGVAYGGTTRFCPRDGAKLVAEGEPAAPAPVAPAAGSRSGPPGGSAGAPPVALPTPQRPPSPGNSPGTAPRSKGPPRALPTGQGPAFTKGKLTPASVPAHATLIGQLLDGRYQVERKLGEGGMSFVYLATETGTETQHAIKVLSPSLSKDATAMARLRREAEMAGEARASERLPHRAPGPDGEWAGVSRHAVPRRARFWLIAHIGSGSFHSAMSSDSWRR